MDFRAPEITDSDVEWVCEVLQLPASALCGVTGDDPRDAILKSNATLDVEACPGSGKTTLLVAKLAILSKRWSDARRGICILSHTNAARREIEKKLGNCAAGQKLLTYPHFVGTIHGFVNQFLALPWLRSLGYPITVIDNNHCEQHRRKLLRLNQFSSLAGYVNGKESSRPAGELNVVAHWRLCSPSFEMTKDNDEAEFKDQSGTAAKQLRALAEKCVLDGYYRYDEMFMWAHDLLNNHPEIAQAIRYRFPMLFIDEVQDNDEVQSALLFKLFTEGDRPVIRQRYGDSNQAIYFHGGGEGATTDLFPDSSIRRDIPNSHRFGQEIADLAKPLGLIPQNLVGLGPANSFISTNSARKNTIFLFSESTIRNVINSYASYLCEVFTVEDLANGSFNVVAGVHYPGKDDKIPRYLGHYWPQYDPELVSTEAKPKTFLQYVTVGRATAEYTGEARHVVDKIGEGVLRLARLANSSIGIATQRRKHLYVLELLGDDVALRQSYVRFITSIAVDRVVPSADEWQQSWKPIVVEVAQSIAKSDLKGEQALAFLEWANAATQQSSGQELRDNVFRYPKNLPRIQLRVGSIHSVKGETHTSTLVLDSFFKKHHLATLKPWLLGAKSGKGKEGPENQSRLKQHYVAMTRPTHLLCLAMRADSLTSEEIETLKGIGWRVVQVSTEAFSDQSII